MLYADKRALETNLQVSLLKIREKELQFYTQNCIAIGTQAALLSGFAYNGIIQVDIPSESSDWLKTAYLCVTTFAMGFELIAVLNATLCSMLGPGLALRGPDGSMHRAVDGLMLEYRLTFLFFTMGLIAFHVSALLFAWLEFSWPVALAMTLALLMFIYGMARYFKRIYQRFALDSDHYITGKFEFGGQQNDTMGDSASARPASLGEVLSGGICALPGGRNATSEAQRTEETRKIIGMVEPTAPAIGGHTAPRQAAPAKTGWW
ncbi:hypothetical protein Ctob_012795 [Chrysochromulina tobinii]|jgi:hypothetical protein|uniref:Uncharacterized protein n=1 Tax=Chrysochromulina tobinii TaxID=1460289 RepID=A0A0M0LSH1_9EUKA|nr:hypothetical protein Ctob_012795 [Chrysochromulina tobinii]|eukprot:KOO53862.1 hypothetical protein Ctob_012795 [Chrysochromulina sp. CCMP291]